MATSQQPSSKEQLVTATAAPPQRLPSLDAVLPIYQTVHFWASLMFTLVMTFGANFYVDKSKLEGILQASPTQPQLKLSSPLSAASVEALLEGSVTSFAGDVITFVIITSLLIFLGAGSVRKRIIEGKAAAVRSDALGRYTFQRLFLFSQLVPGSKARLVALIVQTLLLCGIPVVLTVASLNQNLDAALQLSPHDFLLATATWKSVIAAYCFTVNYAGFHHDGQSELIAPSKAKSE